MMKPGSILLIISIVALLTVAGCIAPPKNTSTVISGTMKDINQGGNNIASSVTTTTPVNVYVTEATPYVTLVTKEKPASGYNTFATPTPFPEDRSCRIYTTTQIYYNTKFSL